MKKLILSLLCVLTIGLTAQNPATYCSGTTKAGQPCKMKVTSPEKYCRFHNPNAIHCAGTKKDGTSCKMQVSKQGEYCHYHSPIKQ